MTVDMTVHAIPVAALLIALAPDCRAESFTGQVVAISDGDTLAVLFQGAPVRVRIADIDAPERGQPFSRKSREALASLCRNTVATVQPVAVDRYGRTVGRVTCAGVDAGVSQVQQGFAWTYTKYASEDSNLHRFERDARLAGIGLWSDPVPTAPWDWRSARRHERRWMTPDPNRALAADAIRFGTRPCTGAEGMLGPGGRCVPWFDVELDLLQHAGGDLAPDAGCGERGGPGYRRLDGKCAAWSDW